MKQSSPKHAFLSQDEEQDYFDGLIRIERKQYVPSAVMHRLHKSLATKRLNVGALGSGKTRGMCEHLYTMALSYPGCQVILARRDLGDLKNTTQREMLEFVVDPEAVERFNVNENILYLKNRSQVLFMETKIPSNFKSYQIVAYGIDEADENPDPELMTILDSRLRQRIFMDGREVSIPYAGIWTYNPTDSDHWLAKLEDDKTDSNVDVFRSKTHDNEQNLPAGYIDRLMSTLAPWEINSLIFGERASRPKGKPVIHGFTIATHVRPLKPYHHLPLGRGWDFGYNKPASLIAQFDPEYNRTLVLREVCGHEEQLKIFAPKVKSTTQGLVGPLFPVQDFGDPHGEDQKDVGEPSIEHLRLHHGIVVQSKRTRIKAGIDEVQEQVLSSDGFKDVDWIPGDPILTAPQILVDPSCKTLIAALSGGYHRDEEGKPVKDGIYDHVMDCLRYFTVFKMGQGLRHRLNKRSRYIPRCAEIGV
jgi:hypothetical protein